MSVYRRFPDGSTERWMPLVDGGEWWPCADDEPETRVREPNEGMIVAPATERYEGPVIIPIDQFIGMLACKTAEGTGESLVGKTVRVRKRPRPA